MVSLTSTLALLGAFASMSVAAPAPAPVKAEDPAILAAYAGNPRLDKFMHSGNGNGNGATHDAHGRRALADDPAIAAAYAANPRLAKFMQGSKTKRDSAPGNASYLCDPVIGPEPDDIKQTTLNDCWLASTMLSMAYVEPWWPISRFSTGNVTLDRNSAALLNLSSATITLTPRNSPNFTHEFKTSYLDSRAIPYSTADEHWWPAAVESAVWAFGNSTSQPTILMDGGRPADGLYLLTGYDANFTPKGTPATTLFTRMQRAMDSPVLLTTSSQGTKYLQAWHIYAVLAAVIDSTGKKQVALRNPLKVGAGGDWYDLDTIFNDIENIVWLPGGQNGPNQ